MAKLLKTRKVGVLAGTEKEVKDEVKRLAELKGADFDRAFLYRMIKDHEDAVALFDGQVKDGQAKDVSGFARDNLPTLRRHLEMAKNLSKKDR